MTTKTTNVILSLMLVAAVLMGVLCLQFNFRVAIIPALAVFWFAVGILLENSKRNWFVGIRTPWTVSSDVVWEKTHKLGGWLFKVAAIISLLCLFAGDSTLWLAVAPIIAVAFVTAIYSYIVYHDDKNDIGR